MTTAVHIDCFSAGLDDLTRAQQADPIAVLRVLARTGRFSIFEATENDVIARTMDRLLWIPFVTHSNGAITDHGLLITRIGGQYPWSEIELTEAGNRLLEAEK